MNKYIKKFALSIVQDEISEKNNLLKESQKVIEALSRENETLRKKYSEVIEDHEIILKDYRVDNIGADGVPPSYLPLNDEKLYKAKIMELNDVYSNETFRELLAYIINFHANLAVTGKIRNDKGDMVDIPVEHVQYMVRGIKSVWELIVGARRKKKELDTSQDFNAYDILPMPTEEGIL